MCHGHDHNDLDETDPGPGPGPSSSSSSSKTQTRPGSDPKSKADPSSNKKVGSQVKGKSNGSGKHEGNNNLSIPLPDWEDLELPPAHVLSHLTDAHCHPTDLTHHPSVYDDVKLGGLASMATIVGDQDKVRDLSVERCWIKKDGGTSHGSTGRRGKNGKGVGVIACYGYHPWFTHLYTLSPPDAIPSKEEHYHTLFAPSSDKLKDLLNTLLPYLPDPISFAPLLDKLHADISRSLREGRLTMLGEVGLDGSAKMRWPKAAKYLHPDHRDSESESMSKSKPADNQGEGDSASTQESKRNERSEQGEENEEEEEEEEEWKRLTPFKVPMAHQRAILDLQMDVAVELGVNISFHSVACAGPSLDALISMRDRHGGRFTNRINVDVHSAGGWSGPFWAQAEKNLLNLYASPSIFITGRSPSASTLIASISTDRILVESDSHDVRLSDRVVWAAAVWISQIKGWKLEGRDSHCTKSTNPKYRNVPQEKEGVTNEEGDGGGFGQNQRERESEREGLEVDTPEWSLEEELDKIVQAEKEGTNVDAKGRIKERPPSEIWTVRTLEQNWARFMRLIED
ncbi:hypothetical protein IAT40_003636 [Kwoniella sp. CBS 6097]